MKSSLIFDTLHSWACAQFLIKRPIFLSWSLTRQCNGSCRYCMYSGDNPGLSTAENMQLLAEFRKAGIRFISMTGGEVLLRKDIGLLIKAAKEAGFYIKINTNGLLLAERIEDVMPVDIVQVSIDGGKATHNSLRGEGSFERAISGLEAALVRGKKIALGTVISSLNAGKLDEVLEICERYRVPAFFQPARVKIYGDHKKNPVLTPVAAFRCEIHRLIELKKHGGRGKYIANSLSGLLHLLSWPEPRAIPCFAGLIHFRVDVDGRVYNCGDDCDQSEGVPILPEGFSRAVSQLKFRPCRECWCAQQVEGNLVLGCRPEAVINCLR